jgi:hypothetical protein
MTRSGLSNQEYDCCHCCQGRQHPRETGVVNCEIEDAAVLLDDRASSSTSGGASTEAPAVWQHVRDCVQSYVWDTGLYIRCKSPSKAQELA